MRLEKTAGRQRGDGKVAAPEQRITQHRRRAAVPLAHRIIQRPRFVTAQDDAREIMVVEIGTHAGQIGNDRNSVRLQQRRRPETRQLQQLRRIDRARGKDQFDIRLRAARFASQLGFTPVADVVIAATELAQRIDIVSAERVRDELARILTSGRARRGFELLDATGLLPHILPEIAAMKGVEQPPEFHPECDVWTHTMLMLEMLPRDAQTKADGLRAMFAQHAPGHWRIARDQSLQKRDHHVRKQARAPHPPHRRSRGHFARNFVGTAVIGVSTISR